jgi:periplasmic protein TonB
MTTLSYPNATAHAPERRTMTIALVAALHLGAIYVLLVSLNIVPSPLPPNTVTVRFIPDTQPKPTVTPPVGPIVMTRPDNPVTPQPPVIDYNQNGDSHPFDGPGTGASNGQTDTLIPASALAGTHTTPNYPVIDRRLGHEGAVRLALAIDAQGIVTGATVEQSSGYDGLDAAAIAWVKAHWRYRPTLHNGIAVATTAKADVTFRLTEATN